MTKTAMIACFLQSHLRKNSKMKAIYFVFCLKITTFVVKKQKIVMPRKNSGMWYEVHPTPVKGEEYVRPKSGA